jgi:hypothetical protein
MKVKFQEPVGPIETIYQSQINKISLKKQDLEKILNQTKKELDKATEKLKTGQYSIIDYTIVFHSGDINNWDYFGNFMLGGSNLTISPQNQVTRFQREYKNYFNQFLDEYNIESPAINFTAEVIAFRDTITQEIEAQDPY